MTFGGERAELQAVEQLEAVVRGIADELASWRTRALKAESEVRESSGRSNSTSRYRPTSSTGRRSQSCSSIRQPGAAELLAR